MVERLIRHMLGKKDVWFAMPFFSADPGNNDTYSKFYADLQMESPPAGSPDPLRRMATFHSRGIASKDNRWSGGNVTRWRNEEYDRLWDAAETELDLVKRTAMFIRMNDLLVRSRPRTHDGGRPLLRGHGESGMGDGITVLFGAPRSARG